MSLSRARRRSINGDDGVITAANARPNEIFTGETPVPLFLSEENTNQWLCGLDEGAQPGALQEKRFILFIKGW
jgi:hypothetical protein